MPALFADLSIAGIPLAFLSIALIVELTPGPNLAYLAALALAEGRRAGFGRRTHDDAQAHPCHRSCCCCVLAFPVDG